ncbi:MAG: PRC-barrel domain-containing protein [Deltaproteobacteria bacterium]|nr:PRC-barrel domain-containing protein [Deltaproteobacteria bacterium]
MAYKDFPRPEPPVMGASTLVGEKVVDAKGKDVGKIEEIMFDTRTGKVAYAVLSFGGILGVGDKLFAVPWKALRFYPDNEQFLLGLDRERLEKAPGFDRDHWPKMGDFKWASEIHWYYRAPPYWE